jgi:prepilin-type N-terminal cleavage/methylation domain-containing protein
MRRPTARPTPTPAPRRRGAFTLIELMIVIVIIGILAALILPAVMGSFRTARIAQVQTEIRGLESAIAQFKANYGIEPPSRIRLFETSAGWTTTASGQTLDPITGSPLQNEQERTRSIALMNRIWPNFDFNNPSGWDFNGDGSIGGSVSLFGPECLVFFLGGARVGPPFAMIGFSKNPTNPFLGTAGGQESREGPYFDFKSSQLHVSTNPAAAGALVYFDSLPGQTMPYVYASSYDGRGYLPADLLVNATSAFQPYPSNLNLLSPYLAGTGATAQKNKSFQIVSPGFDALYGSGGTFDATATNHGLSDRRDYDNITNFSSGLLNR